MQKPANDSQEKPQEKSQESCPRPLAKDQQDQQYRLELKQLRQRAKSQDQPITAEQWDALAWLYQETVLSVPLCQHHSRARYLAKLNICLNYENVFDPADRSSFRRAVMAELFPQHVVSKKARLGRAG